MSGAGLPLRPSDLLTSPCTRILFDILLEGVGFRGWACLLCAVALVTEYLDVD